MQSDKEKKMVQSHLQQLQNC